MNARVALGCWVGILFLSACGPRAREPAAAPAPATVQQPPEEIVKEGSLPAFEAARGAKSILRKDVDPVDRAILDGLRWLLRHERDDGSWSALALKDMCDGDSPCFDPNEDYHDLYDEGVTALALLAFLEVGYGPESKPHIYDPVRRRRHSIGDAIRDGLEWLVLRQAEDGHVTKDRAFLYNEGLAATALVSAYNRKKDPHWKEPAQRALNFLQRAQRPNPRGTGLWGWRYMARSEVEATRPLRELSDADSSVTAWCALALARGREAGLHVEQASIDGALEFTRWITADNGLVGYIDPKGAGATVTGKNDHFRYHPATMSALGMTTRMELARRTDDLFFVQAARQLLGDLPQVSQPVPAAGPLVAEDRLTVDYYYWHSGTRALSQFKGRRTGPSSGDYWSPWSKAVRISLLELQDQSARSCRRGGWIARDRWGHTGGPIYSTAINLLTLELLYLPVRFPWWKQTTPRALVGEAAPVLDFPDRHLGTIVPEALSGRVVLLDFWSPWQLGYEEHVEARKALVTRLAKEPFSLVGVGALLGRDGHEYVAGVDAHLGHWSTLLRPDFEDEIFAQYDARSFPTLIVIDRAGIIRLREASWEESVKMVEGLLEEARAPRQPK